VAEIESDSDGVVLRLTCGDARGDTALVKGVNKVVLPLEDRRQTLSGVWSAWLRPITKTPRSTAGR
jgi:hypothetical protein